MSSKNHLCISRRRLAHHALRYRRGLQALEGRQRMNLGDWIQTVGAYPGDRFNSVATDWYVRRVENEGLSFSHSVLVNDETAWELHEGEWSSLPSAGWRKLSQNVTSQP